MGTSSLQLNWVEVVCSVKLQLASEVEGSLLRLSSLPVGFDAISRQMASELTYIVGHPAGIIELLALVTRIPEVKCLVLK